MDHVQVIIDQVDDGVGVHGEAVKKLWSTQVSTEGYRRSKVLIGDDAIAKSPD